MPDLGRFLDWAGKAADMAGEAARAEGVEYMLGHRGVSIMLVRGGSALAAQTVLLVPARARTESTGEAGQAARAQMTLIGTKGHPTLTDLNIQRGDRFRYPNAAGGTQYEVTHVDRTQPGKVEARADAMQ